MEEKDRWAGEVDVCRLQKNHNTPTLFLLGSGKVRSDIVLFSVCENKILQHHASLESVRKEELDTGTQ